MNLLEAVEARHAARDYTDEPLTGDQIDALGNVIALSLIHISEPTRH